MPVVRFKDWYPGYRAMINKAIAATQPWNEIFEEWGIDRDWHAKTYAKWLREKPHRDRMAAEREKAYQAKIKELDAIGGPKRVTDVPAAKEP